MALIQCSECGKEFSDKANNCPNCGCPTEEVIKANVKMLEEENRTPTDEEILAQKIQYLNDYCQNDDYKVYGKLYKTKECHYCGYFCSVRNWFDSMNYCDMDGYRAFKSGICPSCKNELVDGEPIYKSAGCNPFRFRSIYKKYIRDDPQRVNLAYNRIKGNDIMIKAYINVLNNDYQNKADNGQICPMCQSADIRKIDMLERSASVALTGVASSKIGKQYKCKACGHMW